MWSRNVLSRRGVSRPAGCRSHVRREHLARPRRHEHDAVAHVRACGHGARSLPHRREFVAPRAT
jgi:hypothetical protein